MLAISLTIACSRYVYNGVILHAHPIRGESHDKLNTTGEVATVPLQILPLNAQHANLKQEFLLETIRLTRLLAKFTRKHYVY